MSDPLRDLLHELADHGTGRAAASAPDPTTEVRRVLTGIRARRTRRTVGGGALAVTVLAVGVAAATALTPAPRDPADVAPVPSPSVSTSPSPSASVTPSPSPSATPTATATALPDLVAEWGVVESLATAPRPLWTQTAAVAQGPTGAVDHVPSFVDVTTGEVNDLFTAVEAGGVLVTQVSGPEAARVLAGLDATTGAPLWALTEDTAAWQVCAGPSTGGLVACSARSRVDGAEQVLLVDPADGTVVRTVPLDFSVLSVGVEGDTVIAHGTQGPQTPRWDGIDATSGVTVWSHVEQGDVWPDVGDAFVRTRVQGHVAELVGSSYAFLIDTRTGERTTAGLGPSWGLALMPEVWAPAPGTLVPVFERVTPPGAEGGEGVLRALDLDGSLRWTTPEGTDRLVGVIGDGVFVADPSELVYLDLATGQRRWSVASAAVVATDGARALLAPAGGPVSAVSLDTGSVVWTLDTDVASSPWLTPRRLGLLSSTGEARVYGW